MAKRKENRPKCWVMEQRGSRYRVRGPIETREGEPVERVEEYLISDKRRAMHVLNGRSAGTLTIESADALVAIDRTQHPIKSAATLREEAKTEREAKLVRIHGTAEKAANAKLNHLLCESRRLTEQIA